VTLSYDKAAIPEGGSASTLTVAYWDGKQWVSLESTVNEAASTVSARVSHFTIFAVLAKPTAPPATTGAPGATVTPTGPATPVTTTAAPGTGTDAPTSPLTQTGTLSGMQIMGIAGGAAALGAVMAVVLMVAIRRRR
jgi:hypothetical protein